MITDMKKNILSRVNRMVSAAVPLCLFALTAVLAAACVNDSEWDQPSTQTGLDAYGNKYIEVTNLKSIAEVKALFSSEINNNSLRQVKEPMQIRGVVIGNDEGGNIYNSIYIQDNTGAIAISISQSGLYGAFGIGQCDKCIAFR